MNDEPSTTMTALPSTEAAVTATGGGGAALALPTADQLAPRLEKLHEASFAWALTCCGGNREDAEDVLQTVYQKIFDGRSTFDGRSRLKTWTFAVIWRTAAGLRRKRAWQRALLGRWTLEPKARNLDNPSPQGDLEEAERATRVREALASLSQRQHQVLDLVFYHDHSIREAAEILGLKLGTARVHYQRGKVALSQVLSQTDLQDTSPQKARARSEDRHVHQEA